VFTIASAPAPIGRPTPRASTHKPQNSTSKRSRLEQPEISNQTVSQFTREETKPSGPCQTKPQKSPPVPIITLRAKFQMAPNGATNYGPERHTHTHRVSKCRRRKFRHSVSPFPAMSRTFRRSPLVLNCFIAASACFGPIRFHLSTSLWVNRFLGVGMSVVLRMHLITAPRMLNSCFNEFWNCRM